MIILYRAVCLDEANKTLDFQTLQYYRNREKCFSPNLEWIKTRVQDGKFNNSNSDTNRYKYLLKFEFNDDVVSKFVICNNEWKTNNRKQVVPNRVSLI